MTELTLPDRGDNNWDVQVNAAFYDLEDKINAVNGWEVVTVPTTNTSPGTLGQIAIDNNYLYVCVSTNTWRSIPLNESTSGASGTFTSSDGKVITVTDGIITGIEAV